MQTNSLSYKRETVYEKLGFAWVMDSRLVKLVWLKFKLKPIQQLLIQIPLFLFIYSLVSPMISNILIFAYCIAQTNF